MIAQMSQKFLPISLKNLKRLGIDKISIEVMHQLKEEFTGIFEKSKNLGEGTLKLANWLIKAHSFFPKTVRSIKNWFGEIVGYFEMRKLI